MHARFTAPIANLLQKTVDCRRHIKMRRCCENYSLRLFIRALAVEPGIGSCNLQFSHENDNASGRQVFNERFRIYTAVS